MEIVLTVHLHVKQMEIPGLTVEVLVPGSATAAHVRMEIVLVPLRAETVL